MREWIRRGTEARYLTKVDQRGPDECWPWLASRNNKGYGIFNVDDPLSSIGMTATGAHRYAWVRVNGPIPTDKVVDHMCFRTDCQNPSHMRLLTWHESGLAENRPPITHCKRGHEFPSNPKRHSATGSRVCRECNRNYQREWARARRNVRD